VACACASVRSARGTHLAATGTSAVCSGVRLLSSLGRAQLPVYSPRGERAARRVPSLRGSVSGTHACRLACVVPFSSQPRALWPRACLSSRRRRAIPPGAALRSVSCPCGRSVSVGRSVFMPARRLISPLRAVGRAGLPLFRVHRTSYAQESYSLRRPVRPSGARAPRLFSELVAPLSLSLVRRPLAGCHARCQRVANVCQEASSALSLILERRAARAGWAPVVCCARALSLSRLALS
jgi:hypothetical protein